MERTGKFEMKGDLNYISSSIFVSSYHNMCWNEKRDRLNFLTWFGFCHIFGACLWAWFCSGKNCMYILHILDQVILESKFFIRQSQNQSLNEDLIIVNSIIFINQIFILILRFLQVSCIFFNLQKMMGFSSYFEFL